MSTSALELLDSLREESSFLPPVIFGYLYMSQSKLKICEWASDIPFSGVLDPGSNWLLGLTVVSVLTGAGVYTIAKTALPAAEIWKSSGRVFGSFLTLGVVVDWVFTFLAPLFLVTRFCHGDLVVNSLLFLWVALFATTVWSFLLDRYTAVEGIKGFSG